MNSKIFKSSTCEFNGRRHGDISFNSVQRKSKTYNTIVSVRNTYIYNAENGDWLLQSSFWNFGPSRFLVKCKRHLILFKSRGEFPPLIEIVLIYFFQLWECEWIESSRIPLGSSSTRIKNWRIDFNWSRYNAYLLISSYITALMNI